LAEKKGELCSPFFWSEKWNKTTSYHVLLIHSPDGRQNVSLLSFFGRTRQFENRLTEGRPRLWRIAYSWCHSCHLADDLVQETFAKALRQHETLRDPAALTGWLCSILANCWHDHLRSRKDTDDIDEMADCAQLAVGGPDDDYAQNEIVRRVRQAVALLPTNQREVVTLVDLEEFSYAEVASILAIPIGTVMSRLSRARAALRDRLREREAQPAVVIRLHA
jgi:RNA polymerase sigma-70 factor (ECF subfamily)